MLHGTIHNTDFKRNTALQNCCDIVLNGYNILLTLQHCVVLKYSSLRIVSRNFTLKRHSYAFLCCARLSVSADKQKRQASGGKENKWKTAWREKRRHLSTSPQLPRGFHTNFLDALSPLPWSLEQAMPYCPNYDDHHLSLKVFDKAKILLLLL